MVMEKLKVNPAKVHGRYVYHAVKRLFDIIASTSGLILLSPLFLATGAKKTSPSQKDSKPRPSGRRPASTICFMARYLVIPFQKRWGAGAPGVPEASRRTWHVLVLV